MEKKKASLALDPNAVGIRCPLSGVRAGVQRIVPHLVSVVRVCDRTQKGLKSLFLSCVIHNVQMFINDQFLVKEITDAALEEAPLPAGPRDPRPRP